MSAEAAAILRSVEGAEVPLRGVAASGRLTGLLFELSVEQRYENAAGTNIEAVYTFPVPHRAVLLGLELEIGERKLAGVAVRRKEASRCYEQAMDAGDTAALLEQAGDGLYTVSVGNLMAGERALVRYRYAELLDRAGDYVRLAVPTVIAPRYGNPAEHGLAPHQETQVNLLAEYPFSLRIELVGEISKGAASSPSHAITLADIEGGREVRLAKGAALDRDFILQLDGVRNLGTALVAADGSDPAAPEWVTLVSLDPRVAADAIRALNLKLVVDCSGSMAGGSIVAARRALLAGLARLSPTDRVSLTRFGSAHEHATPGLVAAEGPALARLQHLIKEMQADLGGTEMPAALQAALAIPVQRDAVRDVLLITDGEVWAVEAVLDQAARSGHRLFVVAVGAAPAEALARQLSERTGGACEFVSPNEDVEAAIVRMFRRLRERPSRIAQVVWPAEPLWQAPLPAAVFAGDTVHLLAGFREAPQGEVRVTIADGAGEPGEDIERRCVLGEATGPQVLARIAAARRLTALEDDAAGALAEKYQLVSRFSSFVIVDARVDAEKAKTLPELRAVPQMLAAGWGGTATVHKIELLGAEFALALDTAAMPPVMMRRLAIGERIESLRIEPSFSRDWDDTFHSTLGASAGSPLEIAAMLADLASHGDPLPTTLAELEQLGVAPNVIASLHALVGSGSYKEEDVVRVWIALFARSPAAAGLGGAELAALEDGVFSDRRLRKLRAAVQPLFAGVTADAWEATEGVAAATP
jgi:Ca-activated chloride channel family protein